MSDFLAKPLRKPALVAAVLRAIGRAAALPVDSTEAAVPAVLDRMALAHLTAAIGEDGVRETFAMFADETAARLALFRQFEEGGDRELIEIEACALKGSARTLGASEMSDVARLIEHRAASISADELREAIGWLEEANRRMRREFEADFTQAA
jgi:HPt (histidine-containing phosphotransfer) domain-containing protein